MTKIKKHTREVGNILLYLCW